MPNAQVGAVMMMQGLLPLRLNCPWRAAAAAGMVHSTMLGHSDSAAIGAVQLTARVLRATTSIAAMPAWAPPIERADSLCVALRIDTLIH